MSEPRTWRYRTWGGSPATVVADRVEFHPGHVAFFDSEGSIVLAESNASVNELSQVGTLGSATRGVRPAERED